MKTFLKYLKPYWIFAILAPLTMMGEVYADLWQPKLMEQIIDDGIMNLDLSLILQKGFIMILLTVIGGIMGIASSAFASIASQSFSADLRCDVFSKIMHFSIPQADKFTTGSLITRTTNDIQSMQDFVAMAIRMFVRSAFMFGGGIVMAWSYGSTYGLIILSAIPFQLLIVGLLLSKASPLFSKVQQYIDKLNSVVVENTLGVRVVKAYVREAFQTDRFNGANNDLMMTSYKAQKILALMSPVLMLVLNTVIIIIMYIGGISISQGSDMEPGMIMAVVTYSSQILMSMMMVAGMFQSVTRAKVSASRVSEVLDTIPEICDGECGDPVQSGKIEFKNVSFKYPNSNKNVLSNINITVEPGQRVAIMGMTGCGKSTLVSLIDRFYDVTDGKVLIDGIDVRDRKVSTLRENISFVLQKTELFSGTIADNIRQGKPDATDEEIYEAAQIAQADSFICSFNDGYNTVIGEKGSSLSGGQKQRIAIARAIIRKPKIIIFDDSTSALDLNTEKAVRDALKEKLSDTTIVTVAQRVAGVINDDKIFIIENGTINAGGTHSELLQSSSVYRDIYDSQRKGEDK